MEVIGVGGGGQALGVRHVRPELAEVVVFEHVGVNIVEALRLLAGLEADEAQKSEAVREFVLDRRHEVDLVERC